MKIDAKHIEEMWGPRCDQYEAGCGCCDMWQMWDEIERLRRELAEVQADAERFRWLMRFHGEAIRKAIAPDTNPGTVVHIPTDQPPAIIGSEIKPDNQSLSAQLAAAGYTKRDTRLQCDECGGMFTPQMLPVHNCTADKSTVSNK